MSWAALNLKKIPGFSSVLLRSSSSPVSAPVPVQQRNLSYCRRDFFSLLDNQKQQPQGRGGGGGRRGINNQNQQGRRRMSTSSSSSASTVPVVNPTPPVTLPKPPPSSTITTEDDPVKYEEGKKEEEGFDVGEFLLSWKWLEDYGPGFPVKGEDVHIILSPEEFYLELLRRAGKAERRVTLSSLYLGSGSKEKALVHALQENGERNKELKVKVLLDHSRGSRGVEVSSRTMLIPLINKCANCQVSLYHTPQLRGMTKKLLPERWNEVIGLQHMKIYIFDDSVIISGANLSEDYFTNRQDRYILIENCKDLADFYDLLVDRVTDFSFQLDGQNNVALKPTWKIHPSDGNFQEFVTTAKNHVLSLYEGYREQNIVRLRSLQAAMKRDCDLGEKAEDTWIFPMIQMGAFGITNDKEATCKVFEKSPKDSRIKLATGYFNLTAEYIDRIIKNSASNYEILMAHPRANGFFAAKGFAGGIPAAYTQLAKQFLDSASYANQMYRLSMNEYHRKGWTYHAKGLWYFPPKSTQPAITLLGSPNFGHRSVYRDLETQLYVLTLNPGLRKQLDEEQKYLFSFSQPFITTQLNQPDRVVPLWVRLVIIFFRNFF